VRGSNHETWQLRKNQEIFRFESWPAFCFNRGRRPRVLVPSAPFFIFPTPIPHCRPSPCAQLRIRAAHYKALKGIGPRIINEGS
jgi:hypothetical protein